MEGGGVSWRFGGVFLPVEGCVRLIGRVEKVEKVLEK